MLSTEPDQADISVPGSALHELLPENKGATINDLGVGAEEIETKKNPKALLQE